MQFSRQLILQKNKEVLLEQVAEASGLFARLKGLLGTKSLGPQQGLWIRQCNSIHTFFMQFQIDCLFLSADMKVVSWKTNIQKSRVVTPVWKATSVIETSAGVIQRLVDAGKIQQGDDVHVCP